MRRRRGYLYVAIQFACVGIIALSGPMLPPPLPARLVLASSLVLGLWAVVSMGPGRFRISPYLHPLGRLHRSGPYRFVRHPMYVALILAMLALVLGEISVLRIGAWITLVAVLVLKLRLEEHLLAERYPEYVSYARATRRFLPFVY
jgi:protein-S-isoprenylcysteine O-methyltransferase Ste14